MILIEHVGGVERPMWVAREQRRTTGGPLSSEDPAIAATFELLQHTHHGFAGAERLQTVQSGAAVISSAYSLAVSSGPI